MYLKYRETRLMNPFFSFSLHAKNIKKEKKKKRWNQEIRSQFRSQISQLKKHMNSSSSPPDLIEASDCGAELGDLVGLGGHSGRHCRWREGGREMVGEVRGFKRLAVTVRGL